MSRSIYDQEFLLESLCMNWLTARVVDTREQWLITHGYCHGLYMGLYSGLEDLEDMYFLEQVAKIRADSYQ